jgi:hypothetical protein
MGYGSRHWFLPFVLDYPEYRPRKRSDLQRVTPLPLPFGGIGARCMSLLLLQNGALGIRFDRADLTWWENAMGANARGMSSSLLSAGERVDRAHGGCRSLRTSNSGQWRMEADRVKSIRFPALSTEHSALSTLRGPSLGRVQQWTDARKTLSKPPLPPFFSTPGAATRCRGSIRKSFRTSQIGPVMGVAGRSESLVGIGAPNLPRRFPPHVHDLKLNSRSQISLPREGAAAL